MIKGCTGDQLPFLEVSAINIKTVICQRNMEKKERRIPRNKTKLESTCDEVILEQLPSKEHSFYTYKREIEIGCKSSGAPEILHPRGWDRDHAMFNNGGRYPYLRNNKTLQLGRYPYSFPWKNMRHPTITRKKDKEECKFDYKKHTGVIRKKKSKGYSGSTLLKQNYFLGKNYMQNTQHGLNTAPGYSYFSRPSPVFTPYINNEPVFFNKLNEEGLRPNDQVFFFSNGRCYSNAPRKSSFSSYFSGNKTSYEVNTQKRYTPPEIALSCKICIRDFKRLSSLRLHILSHIAQADIFVCPMIGCSKGFKFFGTVTNHIYRFHKEFKYSLNEILRKQNWSCRFKCYLLLYDFYKLTKQEDANVFRDAFCFDCFTYPVSLKMHPCTFVYSALLICPACKLCIPWKRLRDHCFSSECTRKTPVLEELRLFPGNQLALMQKD